MENFEQNPGGNGRIPPNCTLQEYRKNYASEPLRKSINGWCIMGYVLCGINLLLALFVNIFALVDAAVLLGLTLGIHLGKSKACAIGILAYAIIGAVLSLIGGGGVTGWLWIAMGISCLSTFKKMDAEYKSAMAAANQPTYNY